MFNGQARNSSLDDELKDDASFRSVEFESWNDSWNSKSSVELNSSRSRLQSKNSRSKNAW